MNVKKKLIKAKNSCVNGLKKAGNWMLDHPNATAFIVGIASTVGIGAYIINNVEITPDDIVKYSRVSNGYVLIDAYDPRIYWPTTHGLNADEIAQVSKLIEEENVCTGEALRRLGLLRIG